MRITRLSPHALFVLILALLLPGPISLAQSDEPLLSPQPFAQPTMSELGKSFATSRAVRAAVLLDRKIYNADELHGQALVLFLGHVDDKNRGDRAIEVALFDQAGNAIESLKIDDVQTPKLPVLFNAHRLAPGKYEIRAKLLTKAGETLHDVAASLEKSTNKAPQLSIPDDGIPLLVHAQQHMSGGSWPISTGLAMPRMTVINPQAELSLLENGKPVPAAFTTRATWSPNGYAKWVGVDFDAKYQAGRPLEYRVVRKTADAQPDWPIVIEQTETHYLIDTGLARFSVRKNGFSGIEEAWLGPKRNGKWDDAAQIIGSADAAANRSGSYIVDSNGTRYSSALDTESQVVIETHNPLRATLLATGWYRSEAGDPLCKYVVRITAFAGKSYVHVSHRMINTIADRWDDTRLADVGFAVVPADAQSQLRLAFDSDVAAINTTSDDAHVFLHQDRADHLRIVEAGSETSTGKRSDGWMTSDGQRGSVMVFVQDFFQKYPKEFEYIADSGQRQLVTHFWPGHGQDTFADNEELARDQIYKVRFAHEGKNLELKIPDKYHKQLETFQESEGWAGGAELAIVDRKNNLSKMQVSSGQGTVIGNDMYVALLTAPDNATCQSLAALMQQAPHALPDPAWTCATGVLGPIAPRNPEKFGPAEALLDSAYDFYQRAIIDGGDAYGMWTFGAVHNNWNPQINAPSLTRVWQMSHYQNVFQAWLLYARSGLPGHHQWARIHSNQHLDVGVCNYLAYPAGKHSYSHLGDIGGNIYHCKGFMPWAGNASTKGHWIDISNYYLRYYLTGDRRGVDMGEAWMNNIRKMGNSNEPNIPDDCDGWQSPETLQRVTAFLNQNPQLPTAEYPQWIKDELAKPRQFNPREVLVPLGEMVWYYEATWDPQAIIELDALSEYLDTPFFCTNSPQLSHFGKHWQEWYFGLSRDSRVVERIEEFMTANEQADRDPRFLNFNAFLYNATGDKKWIEPHLAAIHDSTLNIYRNPGDRYHEYSLAQSNPAAMLLGRLPNVLYAIDKAGLSLDRSPEQGTTVPYRSGRIDIHDKWLARPRGWSNAGFTILGFKQQPGPLDVAVTGPKQFGSFRGFYMLFDSWPVLVDPARQAEAASIVPDRTLQQEHLLQFAAPNLFNDPPTHRNVGVGRPENPQSFPYVERANNDPQHAFYRLEYSGDPINLPALWNADTNQPTYQAAVIPRTMFWNNQAQPAYFRTKGVVCAYVRPVSSTAVITLDLKATHSRYSMPTTLTIYDDNDHVIVDTSVLPTAGRETASVTLDPAKHPLPWRFVSASSGDNQFEYRGADELLFARTKQDLLEILPRLTHAQTTALSH